MKKSFLILMIVVGVVAIFSCNRENDPIDENATTRGAYAKDARGQWHLLKLTR